MERWDICNIDRQKTGRTMVRGEKMAKDDYHLVAHVCLFNEQGEMLIQQRSANKSTWANRWDLTVGGSALSGETSRDAAARELKEELGVEYDFSCCRPNLTMQFDHGDRGFDDIFLIDFTPEQFCLQSEEVQAVRWASREEILCAIRDGSFAPYHEELISLLFALRGRWSSATELYEEEPT